MFLVSRCEVTHSAIRSALAALSRKAGLGSKMAQNITFKQDVEYLKKEVKKQEKEGEGEREQKRQKGRKAKCKSKKQ